MQTRYHMNTRDGKGFVEMPNSVMGKQFLEGLRKNNPDVFKYQRIDSVLQAFPDKVRIGVIINYT